MEARISNESTTIEQAPSPIHTRNRIVNRSTFRTVILERRCMGASTFITCISGILFCVASALTGWIRLIATILTPEGFQVVKKCQIGIWMEWVEDGVPDNRREILSGRGTIGHHAVTGIFKSTQDEQASMKLNGSRYWIKHVTFTPKQINELRGFQIPGFFRAQAVFSIVGLLLMISAFASAFYCLRFQHRYIYKRLTAGLYGISAMCVLVVVEVMTQAMNRWKFEVESISSAKILSRLPGKIEAIRLDNNIPNTGTNNHDSNNQIITYDLKFGYCTVIAWLTFANYAAAAVIFIIGSRKRKGNLSATEEFEFADRPFLLGRS